MRSLPFLSALLMSFPLFSCSNDGEDGQDSSDARQDDASQDQAGRLVSGDGIGGGGASGQGTGVARHDFCADIGDYFGMGAAIFGDVGTDWVTDAASTRDVAWTYGYMYASGDPHDDLDGAEWITNYRLDTAQEAGAGIPTVTFYRLLNVGEEHGYQGSEADIVQAMLTDSDAVRAYLDDYVELLSVLADRESPSLVHVEPDSWGFMMWAFDGVDGTDGNGDASSIPVSLSNAAHPDLEAHDLPDDAGGLGQALLLLRDLHAPRMRLGWHASNFRVGTRPDVVTSFYASMGAWDVIVTEPPHMNGQGDSAWDESDEDNQNNLTWLNTVSETTNLPVLIWQAYVDSGAGYLGGWPGNTTNLTLLAEHGVAGVLWDPNGVGSDCGYTCSDANQLLSYLESYSAEPLRLPAENTCAP